MLPNKIQLIQDWLAQSGERPLANPAIQVQLSSAAREQMDCLLCSWQF